MLIKSSSESREFEVSIVIPVMSCMWSMLINEVQKEPSLTRVTKFLYENGLRKLLQESCLTYQQKFVHETETIHSACESRKDLVVLSPMMYKFSTEIQVPPASFRSVKPVAKIERVFLYTDKVRIAVEQKFLPVKSQLEDLSNFYDIWNYESQTCTIHLETEFDSHAGQEAAVQKLRDLIKVNSLVHRLFNLAKAGNCNSNSEAQEDSEESLRRPFAYTAEPNAARLFVSAKLDGERAKFEIINDIMYISQWSQSLKLAKFFAQRLVGHVERVQGRYVIIDLFNYSSVRNKNVARMDHIEAIKVISEIKHIGVHMQKFAECEEDLKPSSFPTDGFLHFYKANIVKEKKSADCHSTTIDLMLKKSVYQANLIDHLLGRYGQKMMLLEDAEGYSTSLTSNNCKPGKHNVDVDLIVNEPIFASLQFNSGMFFAASVRDTWSLDMKGAENLWGNGDIINVSILELLVDLPAKKLRFQRIRTDKYVANSINVFFDMCKSLE